MVSLCCIWTGNCMQSIYNSVELEAPVLRGSSRWKGVSGQKREGKGEQEGMGSKSYAMFFHQPKSSQPDGDMHLRLQECLQSRCW